MATAAIDVSEDPRARVGGNMPPSIKEQALLEGAEALKPLLDRAAELLASASKAKADDADSAGKCADLVRMIRACDAALDDKRKEVQAPYKAAVDVLMDMPRKAKAELAGAKRDLTAIIAEFDRNERKRLKDIADADAARQADEDARLNERAASLGVELPVDEPAAEPARSTKPARSFQSDMGSSAYVRKIDVFTISDPYALPLDILNHPKVTEAIISAALEFRRANPDTKIKGIIVTEEDTTVVR